jgi:hypothetical protein
LAGDRGDGVEVAVVMHDRGIVRLGGSGDQQIGYTGSAVVSDTNELAL